MDSKYASSRVPTVKGALVNDGCFVYNKNSKGSFQKKFPIRENEFRPCLVYLPNEEGYSGVVRNPIAQHPVVAMHGLVVKEQGVVFHCIEQKHWVKWEP